MAAARAEEKHSAWQQERAMDSVLRTVTLSDLPIQWEKVPAALSDLERFRQLGAEIRRRSLPLQR
jgi:hypothetical protein